MRRSSQPADDSDQASKRPANADEVRERTLQVAIKLLAAKPRSVAELRARLLERKWTNEEAVEFAVEKLKTYGYLDDERFAFGFASYRVRQKPVGRQRLARDLRTRMVPREAAEAALDVVFGETPEEALIDRAIEKRLRLRGRPADPKEAKSLFAHLIRLGFSYDLVASKVREIM
jgi:regulatory protein